MSNCENFCLQCNSNQIATANFTSEHGLCMIHYKDIPEFLECIHCKCYIPITLITMLSPENSKSSASTIPPSSLNLNSSNYSLSLNSESLNTKEKCEYCFKERLVTALKCAHKVCDECFSDKCQLCSFEGSFDVLESSCQYCKLNIEIMKLDCGHLLCKECCAKGCNLCEVHSRSQSIYEPGLGKCGYCLQNEARTQCQKGHYTCLDCCQNGCPECLKSFEVSNDMCEACSVSQYYSVCVRGHRVCVGCYEKCSLCDLFASNIDYVVSQVPVKTLSVSKERKCEYCYKEPGKVGNFCSHYFCKECIYEHKKQCDLNEASRSFSIVSGGSDSEYEEESKVSGNVEESPTKNQLPEPRYKVSNELPRSNNELPRSKKAPEVIESSSKQCKLCTIV